jgi:hypothetical protein
MEISIQKADCLVNETFENYVEALGLSCFDSEGNPKNVENLIFEAELSTEYVGKIVTIYKSDLDYSGFEEIRKKLQAPVGLSSLVVQYINPQIK